MSKKRNTTNKIQAELFTSTTDPKVCFCVARGEVLVPCSMLEIPMDMVKEGAEYVGEEILDIEGQLFMEIGFAEEVLHLDAVDRPRPAVFESLHNLENIKRNASLHILSKDAARGVH